MDLNTESRMLKAIETLENKESHFKPIYEDALSLKEKIEVVSKEIYGADGVVFAPAAAKQLARLEELGYGNLPVCMAKNQYSLSDDSLAATEILWRKSFLDSARLASR